MDKIKFINELKNIKLVSHRLGYAMTNYPENSLDVLEAIFNDHKLLDVCDGFEFDICFTKDKIPVVIHDKYIDDISDNNGMIKDFTLDELKKFNFGFRKSLNNSGNLSTTFKIVTLEEILTFFEENIDLLGDKIIKVETKDYVVLNSDILCVLADILTKFPLLAKNIVHLSYWPLNLSIFRKIQKKKNYQIIRNDLLCDFNFLIFLSRFVSYIDNLSLRIKITDSVKPHNNNSRRVNNKIAFDSFWSQFSNVIKEANLKYAIDKYGSVGLFTLNDMNDIDEICKHISDSFFENNFNNFVITTNNPAYLRKIKCKK